MYPSLIRISQNNSVNDQSRYARNLNGHKSYRAAASRKNNRKQERLARKQNKAVYFSNSNTRKRGAEEELVESPQRKKLKSNGSNAATTTFPKVAKSLVARSVEEDIVNAPVATPERTDAPSSIKVSKESTIATKGSALLKKKSKSSTVKLKPPKEDKEDAYIAYLESKLGIDKTGKKKGKKVVEEEDGLDGTLQCFFHSLF